MYLAFRSEEKNSQEIKDSIEGPLGTEKECRYGRRERPGGW